MLLQLPKDIIWYILSLVVFDIYVEGYPAAARHNKHAVIESITGGFCNFNTKLNLSIMANAMHNLSLVHPCFRACLTRVSKNCSAHSWCFQQSFFRLLA